MKRLAPLLIALFPAFASAQTVPPPFSTFGAVPTIAQWQTAWASKLDVTGALTIGGASGTVQYNNGGALGGFVVSGDGTLNTGTGALAVTKTGGTAFAALATTVPGTGVTAAVAKATNLAAGGLLVNAGAPLVVAVRSASTSPVTVSATTDYFLCLDPTSVTITVNLPASPTIGLTYLVKDCTGQSASHSIIVTPAAGNIDGAASFTISTAFSSVAVTYTGSQWSIN